MTVDLRVLKVLTKLFSSGWFWFGLVALFLAGVFAWEVTHQEIMSEFLNPAIWVMTNLVLFFGYAMIVAYMLLYGLVFDWMYLPDGRANIGGRLIFALMASLTAIVGRSLIGIFLVPTTGRYWYEAPVEPAFWYPTVGLLVYVGAVTTVTVMTGTLVKSIIRNEPLDITVPSRAPRE